MNAKIPIIDKYSNDKIYFLIFSHAVHFGVISIAISILFKMEPLIIEVVKP